MIKLFLLFLYFADQCFTDENLFDLQFCKLTHTGSEYIGKLSSTESNETCEFWDSATQIGAEKILDEDFPDGSKKLAKNYCRNPNKDPKGPWCYTTKSNLINDTCAIPICKSSECRMSGIGIEYFGSIDSSVSGKKCTKWNDKHKLMHSVKETTFKNKFFPDESIKKTGRKCRNPNGNIGGPWCYIENEDTDLNEIELCDIPFCDTLGTLMYSQGSFSGQYYFFSSFNSTGSLNISFRLWDPADWLQGQIYLYLSAYDIALDRQNIDNWKSGVEIMISHLGSGVLSKDLDEDLPLTSTPLILSGAKWTELVITWMKSDNSSILIQAFEKNKTKPLAISEIYVPQTIFEFESFQYISLSGSPSFWNIASEDEECPVHTIPQMNFTRFWLMKKNYMEIDLEFFVRAKQEAVILLRSSPMIESKQVQVIIGQKDLIKIMIFNEKKEPQSVKEKSWPNILDFWKWKYFKLALIRELLQLFWVRESSTELIMEVSHPHFAHVNWVSFASPVISYWTIYCDPRGLADPPPASPPECSSQNLDQFNGTLSVTKNGHQCIPWIDKNSIPEKYQNEELFAPYGGKSACKNFCRNLDNDPQGAFCIVRDVESDLSFSKEYCYPRSCNVEDCKIAGTGNDYLGKWSLSRSKRQCIYWTEIADPFFNDSSFPDPSIQDAENFCRNPSRSVSGCWCYTLDPDVPWDSCLIKDCDKPLECTVLTTKLQSGTDIYILPHWRKSGLEFWLKAWNPDIYEGVKISLTSLDGSKEYVLLIGDEENEKVKLFFRKGNSNVLLERKTLPHLVPTGKWGGYWLRPGKGQIELGYHGVTNSFFEWSSTKANESFEAMFLNFGTIGENWIGINFQCSECLVERISVSEQNKIYPINIWRNTDEEVSNLTLNLRGNGSAVVTLMWTPDFNRSLAIQIDSEQSNVFVLKFVNDQEYETLAAFPMTTAISEKEWSEYTLDFTEYELIIYKDGETMLAWESPFSLLFYWFSVTAIGGTIIWSANCPQVGEEPRDGSWGDWGPWTCSVTCGRGEGRVERKCDKPSPNVFGKECKGSPIYEGPCNDFPCGQISPDTFNSIRQYLSSQYKALEVYAKEKVTLHCNPQGLSSIINEVTQLNITWTHNGVKCNPISYRIDENFSLVIPSVQEKHNGVFLCTAHQGPKGIPPKIVLEVVSLVVIEHKSIRKVRKGRSMILKCNGLALSYVYADLSQRWELNGNVWKEYGIGALEVLTTDKLENVDDIHSGIWTCVVIQEDFKFKWVTNWINLTVLSAPSFWSHLMEDVATAPIFGKLGNETNTMLLFFFLLALFLGLTIAITFSLIMLLQKRKDSTK